MLSSRVWRAVLLIAGSLGMLGALVFLAPIGCDYPVFKNAAVNWLAGETRLFDAGAVGFFYAPWTMALFAPLSYLPDRLASGLVNFASLAGLVLAVHLLIGDAKDAPVVTVVAVANIWTANLIGSTQWDALITAAIAVAYHAARNKKPWLLGAALAFLGTKPTNAWLPTALILVVAYKERWTPKLWLNAALIPSLCVASSFFISGWDWMLRYFPFMDAYPPHAGYSLAFWAGGAPTVDRFLEIVALVTTVSAIVLNVKRDGFNGVTVALGLVLNLMVSPYVMVYHYVAAVPALVWLGRRDSLWLVWIYAASLIWVVLPDPLVPVYPAAVGAALLVAQLLGKAHNVQALPAPAGCD